jgi:hypothetical protein
VNRSGPTGTGPIVVDGVGVVDGPGVARVPGHTQRLRIVPMPSTHDTSS